MPAYKQSFQSYKWLNQALEWQVSHHDPKKDIQQETLNHPELLLSNSFFSLDKHLHYQNTHKIIIIIIHMWSNNNIFFIVNKNK